MHFKRDCPHALKNKRDSVLQTTDIEEDVNKVYDYSQENKQQLMQEAVDMAIMDSACTKTGCMWRDICLESLSKEEREKKSNIIQVVQILNLAEKQKLDQLKN